MNNYMKCLTSVPSFQMVDDLVGVSSSLLDNHFAPCPYKFCIK